MYGCVYQEKIFSWYTHPYTLHLTPTLTLIPEPKQKVFNFAGLIQSETEKWFERTTKGATWQIKQYGSKAKKQERLSEQDMVTTYGDQWGILMAGYWHAGSGWWRARPQQVADAGSILICEDKEGIIFGESYTGLTCEKIEGMSDEQLVKLAATQKEEFYTTQPLDKTITKRQIEEYFACEF